MSAETPMTRSGGRKRQPTKESDEWSCSLCKEAEGLELSDFKKHILEAHGLGFKGTLKPLIHADGDDFFMWSYEVRHESGKSIGTRVTVQRRRGADKAMWDAAR